VRNLAQRASQAAKDIKDLIHSSSSQVQEGVELVNKAGTALNEIVDSIKKVADIVSGIAVASAEQSTGIDQINTALSQMDEVTQQNSALVEENAASAKALEQQADTMSEQVSVFRTRERALDADLETADEEDLPESHSGRIAAEPHAATGGKKTNARRVA
jgi:methyl-accepting chemotaxis protein